MSMFIGEALVGEGNEIAHIDLIIGSKEGPAGIAFANALGTTERRAFEFARSAGTEPGGKAGHRDGDQGDDQGCQAGGADVRARAGRGCSGGGGFRCRRRDSA